MKTGFKRNSVAAALANEPGDGARTPLTPPKCEDCAHYRLFHGGKWYRPNEAIPATWPTPVPACYDEPNGRGIDAREVRGDEDGCGPDGAWFEPKIVLVQ